jgi:hypothetical protein
VEVISFGKHRGKSFEEVSRTDAEYCQWAVQSARKHDASPAIKKFAAFVETSAPDVAAGSAAVSTGAAAAMVSPSDSSKEKVTPWSPRAEPSQPSFQNKKSWKPAQSFPDSGKTWKTQARPPMDSHSVISGNKVLGGGKYPDKTYAEVFKNDPLYCKWIVEWGTTECSKRDGWQWPFIVYVQHRWLTGDYEPPVSKIELTAQRMCLEGASFAITGRTVEMPRHILEELICFFGGRVSTSLSSKTTYLIVGEPHFGGASLETGAKYAKAVQLDVPRLKVAELLEDLRMTADEGDQVMFTSGAHAKGGEHVE